MSEIDYKIKPSLSDESLNALFPSAWENHVDRTFEPILIQSLTYICAFDGSFLVGFVNVAWEWDGDIHGFILDTTVHTDYRRRGIGTELMKLAAEESRIRGIEWLHVDYEPQLETFYRGCGYRKTEAGLLNLSTADSDR
jgi:ribosomal protein S18 acetylase RimI-like enzyme